VIIVRDLGLSNRQVLDILSEFDVRIYLPKMHHDKFLITDKYLLVGSANFTYQSFFEEENHLLYYERGSIEWNDFYKKARDMISKSKQINFTEQLGYNNTKDTLPPPIPDSFSRLNPSQASALSSPPINLTIKNETPANTEQTAAINSQIDIPTMPDQIELVQLPNTELKLQSITEAEQSSALTRTDNDVLHNLLRLAKEL
jgi:phosphatidylserine/phosphatidylglycerophosphate/cardiolipin synthase-like enzyme